MEYLSSVDGNLLEEKKLYSTLFDVLSFEKIAFSGKIVYLLVLLSNASVKVVIF